MTRASVIDAAGKYLQSGLVNHNPAKVPLAADCIRVQNGRESGGTGAAIAERLARTSVTAIRNLKWVVHGQDAVTIFELETPGGVVFISEYQRVSRGLIKEIRVTYAADELPARTIVPVRRTAVVARNGNRPETVRVAARYLEGLRKRDLRGVPLADEVTMTENGRVVARGLAAAKRWLEAGLLSSLQGVSVTRWVAEGGDAVALYEVDAGKRGYLWFTHYFRVYAGKIRELQANFGLGPRPA